MAASASLVGLAVVVMNVAVGFAWPLQIGSQSWSVTVVVRVVFAYWFTLLAASAFLFGCVMTVQGFSALILPRWLYLRFSAAAQLVSFGVVLGSYSLLPSLSTPAAAVHSAHHWSVATSPCFWFFAMFEQLRGALPADLEWIAARAWIALGAVIVGAITSLLLCCLRTMKRTLEQPDLAPRASGSHWTPSMGNSLRAALVLFSFRSLTRSRQHRLAFGFFAAIVCLVALSWARAEASSATAVPINPDFLISTFIMMTFAVFGLRSVFALPISLNANWVLRTTQLRPSDKYISGTRLSLILLAVVPVWTI